jgi:alcohol dehydrogenase
MRGETAPGLAAERVCLPAANLVRVPDEVSLINAAALPVAYGTALRMLSTRGAVKAGEKVVVLGAAGGVGSCCVQLAKTLGAEVFALATGAWKLDRLRELGADHVLDMAARPWVDAVRALAGKPRVGEPSRGVDVVVNFVGGDTWEASQRVLKQGGRMLCCGASAGHMVATDLRYLWSYEHTLIGSDGWTHEDQAELLLMVAQGRLRPVIDSVRPFSQAALSMQALIERRVFGKALLRPDRLMSEALG